MGEIEKKVRVCAGETFDCNGFFFCGRAISNGSSSGRGQSLWEIKIEIHRLGHDEEEGESGGGGEGIRCNGAYVRKCCAKGRAEREGDREAGAYESHSSPSLLFITDIRRHGRSELNIPLTQPSNNPTSQECPEIRCRHPKGHGCDISSH